MLKKEQRTSILSHCWVFPWKIATILSSTIFWIKLKTSFLPHFPLYTISAFLDIQFSSDQSLSCVRLFATPHTAACQASLSITSSRILFKFMSSRQWYHPTISSSVIPFSSCLQSFSGSGSLQWVSCLHQEAKVLAFQLQHQLGWIFRAAFL